jgi:hypothetical protein
MFDVRALSHCACLNSFFRVLRVFRGSSFFQSLIVCFALSAVETW